MWRTLAIAGLTAGTLAAAELPAWWQALPRSPRLESAFVQESESAVFGKLRREGRLWLAEGGKLRVEYRKGLVLVCDGKTLVQYDPQVRTAQRMDLKSAAGEAPMLNILVNPRTLAESYNAKNGPGPNQVTLEPRRPGIPAVLAEGQGALLKRITWTDPTGAKQVLELLAPKVPATLEAKLFSFQAPAGVRWLGAR